MSGKGKVTWVILVLVLVYGFFYVVVRYEKCVVHTCSYSYDTPGNKVYTSHDVVAGDAKLASPNGLIAAFFAPLTWMETRIWYLIRPIDSRL